MTREQLAFILQDPSLANNRIIINESDIQAIILSHLKDQGLELPEKKLLWVWANVNGSVDLAIITPPETEA